MTDILIAYDESDEKLGSYFLKCKNDITLFFEELEDEETNIVEICAVNCHDAYIDISLVNYEFTPFLFIAFTHGSQKGLTSKGNVFVSTEKNYTLFNKSFVYANSCLAGLKLGPHLISCGCKAFIGYENEIYAFIDREHEEISVKCDNSGLKAFYTQGITAFEAYESMQTYYSNQINRLTQFGDMFRAAILVNARESLVFHGDRELKKDDLFLTNG